MKNKLVIDIFQDEGINYRNCMTVHTFDQPHLFDISFKLITQKKIIFMSSRYILFLLKKKYKI